MNYNQKTLHPTLSSLFCHPWSPQDARPSRQPAFPVSSPHASLSFVGPGRQSMFTAALPSAPTPCLVMLCSINIYSIADLWDSSLPPTTVRAPLLSKVLCSAQGDPNDGEGWPWLPTLASRPYRYSLLMPCFWDSPRHSGTPGPASSSVLFPPQFCHTHRTHQCPQPPSIFSASSSTPIKLHPISTLAVSLHNWCILVPIPLES